VGAVLQTAGNLQTDDRLRAGVGILILVISILVDALKIDQPKNK